MNIFDRIQKQIQEITETESSIFLDSVSLHLERAEYYYNLGENDSYYYNDVIYRTNHAFEGALKEAYKILANKTNEEVTKQTPYKIEKYFEDNGVFKERVLELFKNYRSEWRNKSTHDYKLFFDNNEAFIAITSVSSFVFLLFNQIIEKIAFDYEQDKINTSKKTFLKLKEDGMKVARGLFEMITMSLVDNINYEEFKDKSPLETQIIGFLKANLSWYFKEGNVLEEPKIKGNLRPDFIIELSGDKIVLEVKKFSKKLNKKPMWSQLLTYLRYADIKEGIVFALDVSSPIKPLKIEERVVEFENKEYTLRIINN
ncbi:MULTISPECIES: hypothetical protein [unclassified Cellulophaga]|uniref:hypothetical protein n=1 Tax=unclassified Cellulophaga TaxID=2634405 RepID=UPI0026E1EFC9|nr:MULTISPECIES: hypothetical protein [unclassified Cellulophaga]MDO6493085.1 hypothetical protein [Cellulophaga sp. 2_MG-2023]MDO6496406.1 hypothetical protein [Cellulophaga sp. 3_MG-2023]